MGRGLLSILIVDDLPDWRRALSGLLADEGFSVQTTGSAREAIALLGASSFDLAIVDVRLDDSDEGNEEGLNLAAEIGRRWPAVRVIIVTGYDTPTVVRRALEMNACGQRLAVDYVPKSQAVTLPQIARDALRR